jgi:hypothetical protein
LYPVNGTRYAWFPSWSDHQWLSHPKPSQLPSYDTYRSSPEYSGTVRNVPDHSDLIDKDRKGSIRIDKDQNTEQETSGVVRKSPDSDTLVWKLSETIAEPLLRTRFTVLVSDQSWWQSQFRAHAGVQFGQQVLEAEAWCVSNPVRAPHKNYRRFLNGWFARSERT